MLDGAARLDGGARGLLAGRLRARRVELERAALARVYAVSGSGRGVGPEYAGGLREAVASAVDLGVEVVELGDGSAAIPDELLAQARLAARDGVELATVLRRYAAGYSLLGQFVAEEAEAEEVAPVGLAHLLGVLAMVFDRIVVAVTEEYRLERARPEPVERRRAELVKNLLNGAFVDTSSLGYDFEAHHVAVIARGQDVNSTIDALAQLLDCARLTVPQPAGTVWAWLGRRDPPLLTRLDCETATGTCIALGEPAHGTTGWRRSHEQAAAAFLVATRVHGELVRYRDVALVASALQDELLASSLRELYLDPLREGRDGEALIETLSAYFDADRNRASAAATLGISRQGVQQRLRIAEERIGRPLATCAVELETALDIDRLSQKAASLAHVKQ